MGDWKVIRLAQARQVAELMGAKEDDLPAPDVSARARYDELREAGALEQAVDFIGHALPRLEAVTWAARVIDAESRKRTLRPRDRLALDHVLRWIGDPDDTKRRGVFDAAEVATNGGPEQLLGYAVFFSGGSMTPADLQPILPPAGTAGCFAAGAVRIAAHRNGQAKEVLADALDLAEAVAEKGMKALATA